MAAFVSLCTLQWPSLYVSWTLEGAETHRDGHWRVQRLTETATGGCRVKTDTQRWTLEGAETYRDGHWRVQRLTKAATGGCRVKTDTQRRPLEGAETHRDGHWRVQSKD